MVDPIFLAVIVAKFFACGDVAFGDNEDAMIIMFQRLAIWRAGMIDIARDVLSALTVYCFVLIELEKVLSAKAVGLRLCDYFAPIFGHNRALFNRPGCEKPETMSSALHLDVFV